jgi:hypothetical protein
LHLVLPDLIIGLTSVKHLLVPSLAVLVAWTCTGAQRPQDDARIDFKRDIEPILISRCYSCHGPKSQLSGLRLDERNAALKGGDSGVAAIVPGRGAESGAERGDILQFLKRE